MSAFLSHLIKLCRIAAMVALYVLLNMVAIKAGNLRLTFASLPVVLTALLYGPLEAALVAFLGEFTNQMLSYGFTATTVLWLIPPALRGMTVGLGAGWLGNRSPLENRPVACYAVCIVAAIATTAVNTLVIWLDSVLYGYYTPVYVFGATALRLVTGVVTAVVIATVVMPLARTLRRQGLAKA